MRKGAITTGKRRLTQLLAGQQESRGGCVIEMIKGWSKPMASVNNI